MCKRTTGLLAALMALAVLFAGMLPVFAAGGAGDGSGSAREQVLALESASVVDGDSNISIHVVLELTFTGKVDELEVLEHNKDCLHLTDNSGNSVPIRIWFPDTQVQKTFRNQIFVSPQQALAPSAAYTLTVDAALLNKDGATLGETKQIRFTTAAEEADAKGAQNGDLSLLGDNILSYETATPPAAAVSVSTEDTSADQTTGEDSGTNVHTLVRILIPVLLLAVLLVFGLSLHSARRKMSE